jgi:hypothetical protein
VCRTCSKSTARAGAAPPPSPMGAGGGWVPCLPVLGIPLRGEERVRPTRALVPSLSPRLASEEEEGITAASALCLLSLVRGPRLESSCLLGSGHALGGVACSSVGEGIPFPPPYPLYRESGASGCRSLCWLGLPSCLPSFVQLTHAAGGGERNGRLSVRVSCVMYAPWATGGQPVRLDPTLTCRHEGGLPSPATGVQPRARLLVLCVGVGKIVARAGSRACV